MKIAQVRLWIQNSNLPDQYNVTVDNEVNGTCRVVIKRTLAEPKQVQSIDDLIAGLDNTQELVWRGWTFEPDFAWEFQKALEYAKAKA